MQRRHVLGASAGLLAMPLWAATPADPFDGDPFQSYQWPGLKKEFLGAGARTVFDARVTVQGPAFAEDPMNVPFNPLAVAIALDASFVARAYVGNTAETRAILRAAISHRGYALVDLLQPCVTFNKQNTYQWFAEHTARLPDDHDPADRVQAFARACEDEPLLLGIFYQKDKPVFEDQLVAYADDTRPLYERRLDLDRLAATMRAMG